MNLGHICIILSFIASLAAAYFLAVGSRTGASGSSSNRAAQRTLGIRSYWIASGSLILASIIMFVLLMTHQFQYSYVAQYSSRDLPTLYLISAFWAGQEGTFLFWAVTAAVMGLVFMRSSIKLDG